MISYLVGWSLGKWGPALLLTLDAGMSFIALFVAFRWLQVQSPTPVETRPSPLSSPSRDDSRAVIPPSSASNEAKSSVASPLALIKTTTLVAFYGLMYELLFSAIPAKLRISEGAAGIEIFSQMMFINVAFCAVLTVYFTRWFKSPKRALPLGLLLVWAGTSLSLLYTENRMILFVGFFLLTIGELIFQSLGQFMVIKNVGNSSRSGTWYGVATGIQALGRVIGSAAAFRVFVYSPHSLLAISVLFCLLIAAIIWTRDVLPIDISPPRSV